MNAHPRGLGVPDNDIECPKCGQAITMRLDAEAWRAWCACGWASQGRYPADSVVKPLGSLPALPVSFAEPLWHVAHTAPRAELRACRDIGNDLGFDTYCPVEKQRGKAGQGPVERALFPRYVFVAVDPYRQAWQSIEDVDGIVDVLRSHDDVPGHVPTAWIEALRKAEQVGVFDRTTANASMFDVGETVRLSEGPFAGHNGLIEKFIAKLRSAKASKRAKILVDFMGRAASIEVELTSLEKL